MNRHGEKERWLVYPSFTLQNAPYKDYINLLVLTSFEVATVWLLWIPKSPPAVMMATCWLLNEVGANMQLTL